MSDPAVKNPRAGGPVEGEAGLPPADPWAGFPGGVRGRLGQPQEAPERGVPNFVLCMLLHVQHMSSFNNSNENQ